jgi:hypothetical protein
MERVDASVSVSWSAVIVHGLALYQGMTLVVPQNDTKEDGFSRWTGRQGLKPHYLGHLRHDSSHALIHPVRPNLRRYWSGL